MANKEISGLTAASTLDGTELVHVKQGANSRKATTQSIADLATLSVTSWKQAVRVATTAAGTLASDFENGDTVDGVTLATGDRILIKDQATASENGIYTVSATGSPTRATDANSGAEMVGAIIPVCEGTANAEKVFQCTNNATITLDSTNLVFVRFPRHRGCLVHKAANQTGANYSAGAAIGFDTEAYDTDGIHDNSTNNTRLTVPAGVSKVRLTGNCYLENVTGGSDTYLYFTKNGVQAVVGMANQTIDTTSNFPRANIVSSILAVVQGDYFEEVLLCADISIDLNKDLTWFAMEIIE